MGAELDRSYIGCSNKVTCSAFVQTLLIHVVLNTCEKLNLLRLCFREQPAVHLLSAFSIPVQTINKTLASCSAAIKTESEFKSLSR